MPTFTYKTEIIPEVGPPNNGITYGSGHDTNRLAKPFHAGMHAEAMMGILPEKLRNHPAATRHTVNTSIHYAEKLAGRKQFIRWALAGDRVVECPNYPGDSMGFQAIEPYLRFDIRRVPVGKGFVQAVPLQRILIVVQELLKKDPLALLCDRLDCGRCNAVRLTER
jgi:aminoglycoside 3-N-acetyltransferase